MTELERFDNLYLEDKDVLLEFLDNLTEGDIREMGRNMLMDGRDIRKVCDAFDRFKEY